MADTRKLIAGALRNCIHAHGPITENWIDSAAKRIEGQLAGANFDNYWRRRYAARQKCRRRQTLDSTQ